MAKSICRGCNGKFPTEEMVIIKKKKYCKDCFQPVMAEEEERRKSELTFKCDKCHKEVDVGERHRDNGVNRCNACYAQWRKDCELLRKLTDYIWEKQNKDQAKIILAGKQIQTYLDEYGYSYNGIYLTLKYYVEVLHGDISNTIGVVPYYYDEAKKFFNQRIAILNQIRDLKEPVVSYEVKTFKAEPHNPRLSLPDIRIEDIKI